MRLPYWQQCGQHISRASQGTASMLTDAALRRAIRETKQDGRSRTLADAGKRGDGRLVAVTRNLPSGPLLEFYARQISSGRRTMAKLGSYPLMSLEAARSAFAGLSPAIRDGQNVRARRDLDRQQRAELGTLLDLCNGFADSLGTRRSAPEVRRSLVRAPGSACKAIGGHIPACEVTAADVAAWLRPIHKRAPVAAKQYRAWLSAAYTWGLRRENDYTVEQPVRWGLKTNPAAMVPAHIVAKRGGTRHLSAQEFGAVWAWLASEAGRSDLRACNAIRLMMSTGQRVEEITGLRAGQYADGWLRWGDTKIGRQRQQAKPHSIPVPGLARVILDAMQPNRHGLYIPGCKRPDEPYRDASMNWITRRCAKQLGIPHFSPRDCRRTWRTLAGDLGGLTAEECARIMGHSYGSRVEELHYDRGDNAAVKLAGMRKWEAALVRLVAADGFEPPTSGL